jgi:hypothetical protein
MICPKCEQFMTLEGEWFYCPICKKYLLKGFNLAYYEQVANVRRVIRCDSKKEKKVQNEKA